MITVIASIVLSQSSLPAINPASFYGLRTYPTNPAFGIYPDGLQVGFVPANINDLTMHVLKADGTEIVGGNLYESGNIIPAFRTLRFAPSPTLEFSEAGKYTVEFRNKTTPVSRFPFEITKKATGDEFNPTVSWDYKTPVDNMGALYFDNSKPDGTVYAMAWFAPGREGIPNKAGATVELTHNGKVLANHKGLFFQKPHNFREVMILNGVEKFKKFGSADLLKLNGNVVLSVKVNGKQIRKFVWAIADGKVKLHPRSESSFAPRTDYWIPRYLGGREEGYSTITLMEHHWSTNSL